MTDLKAAALEYWSQGCNVILLKGKQPLHEWRKWQKERQSQEEFEDLSWSQADGFGVLCGTQLSNGLYFGAVDYDVKNLQPEAVEKGRQVLKNMLCTQIEETPSHGQHWIYFCHSRPRTSSSLHNNVALELLGEGKLCFMAPSLNYRKLNDSPPSILNDLEEAVYEAMWKAGVKPEQDKKQEWFDREDLTVKPYEGDSPRCIRELLKGVGEGTRNEATIRLSSFLVNFCGMETEKALWRLKRWNKLNNPSLLDEELFQVFRSSLKGYVFGCDDALLKSKINRIAATLKCELFEAKRESLSA